MVAKKPNVLIVDDEQVVCDLLYSELNESGYLCTIALNGNDALRKLAAQHFDVVLLDIKLPGLSGVEVLRRIRSAHHDTAAIMITAINDVDTAVETTKLGAVDYIVKPFSLDRVNASMCTALKAKKHLKQRRNCEILCLVGDDWEDELNAIALGVEAEQDLVTRHSKIVTQGTIDVARQLGIPEKEIRRWAAARAKLDSETKRVITRSLDKFEQSPLAQSIMGMAVPHLYTAKPDESQN